MLDVVTFHGHVDDATRDRILARAWVMALPSVKEGWGIAVTEAAAQGTPTIGYRSSGGLEESIVDGVTGWLVDDVDGLVVNLDAVLSGRTRPGERLSGRDGARGGVGLVRDLDRVHARGGGRRQWGSGQRSP